MSSESAACTQDPKQDDVGSKPMIGTLVEVSQEGDLMVEFDGPDGSARRCTTFTVVPLDAGMVGQPVELAFVAEVDRLVVTRVIDIRAVLRARWEVLGLKVLGLDPEPGNLSAMVEEFRMLACMVAWVDAAGSITYGAERIGTSRRSLRLHVRRWTRHNPRLAPPRRPKQPAVEQRAPKAAGSPTANGQQEVE